MESKQDLFEGILRVAELMNCNGVDIDLIAEAVHLSVEWEGIADLVMLYEDADTMEDEDAAIEALKEAIEDVR